MIIGWYRLLFPVGIFWSRPIPNKSIDYGPIQTTSALGRLVRVHRKQRGLTLETLSGLGNLSTRFLSEFERGKETAEIGKVRKALHTLGLEVIIRPRGQALGEVPSGDKDRPTP